MSFRFCTLASGSEGNVGFMELGSVRLLVDAGLSYKALSALLKELEVEEDSIDALLLTHEHRDHTLGLPVLLKKLDIPVYLTRGTFEGLAAQKLFERVPKARFQLIPSGGSFSVAGVKVTAIPISHDANEPVAYRVDGEEAHLAVVTDLGCFDERLIGQLQGLNALVLEANHNRQMLETGPYPYPLKLRIESDKGHLSNETAASLLDQILHPGLEAVILGHLSRVNNYPLLALKTVQAAIRQTGSAGRIRIAAAPPKGLSELVTQ